MTGLSDPQKEALEQIQDLHLWMIGNLHETDQDCWFTQDQLNRVTLHTLRALERKGVIESKVYSEMHIIYYRWTGKELE